VAWLIVQIVHCQRVIEFDNVSENNDRRFPWETERSMVEISKPFDVQLLLAFFLLQINFAIIHISAS